MSTSNLLGNREKKQWNMNVSIIPIVIGDFVSHQMIINLTEWLENKRTNEVHPNY